MSDRVVPVSVVIPCFRCAVTVRRAVQSVVQQTHKPVEVILVDDASDDATPAVLREIESQHPGWVKVILLDENSGAGSARNSGWAIATQPYITFLDADDSWHVDKLQVQYNFMKGNGGVVLCGHQCIRACQTGNPLQFRAYLLETDVDRISLLFRNPFSTPTVMLSRDIPFRFLRGRRHSEDFLLWQQIAWAGFRVVRLEIPLAYVHKPFYGSHGLSGALWKMEKGELDNFAVLFRSGAIGLGWFSVAALFSMLKFVIRSLNMTWLRLKSILWGRERG